MGAPTKPKKKPTAANTKTADDARKERVTKFDKFRARAKEAGYAASEEARDPYVLGPEDGFDPPIEIKWPGAETQILMDRANRQGDEMGMLIHLVGQENLMRIARTFEDMGDSDILLLGFTVDVLEHFLGKGVAEAGGIQPS